MPSARSDWPTATRAALDHCRTSLVASEVRAMPSIVHALTATIEPPPDDRLGAALSIWLLDLVRWLIDLLHDGHAQLTCRCGTASWAHVRRFTAWETVDPRAALHDWTRAFFPLFASEHPPTPAARTAAILRSGATKVGTLKELARSVGVPPTALRREFQDRFGMTPAAYVHLVRVTHAVREFRTATKVEAIALGVGYRSKKDLYRALARWIGATPTELRHLSDEERAWLERQLMARALRGGPADLSAIAGVRAAAERRAPRR